MTDRRRRPKASDLDSERHLTDSAYSFAAAFPEVSAVEVTVVEDGRGVGGWNRERRYTLVDIPDEYVDCHNPVCYGGGVALGALLRDAARARRTIFEVSCMCRGDEASARGGRRYGLCLNMFHVRMNFVYVPRIDSGDRRPIFPSNP